MISTNVSTGNDASSSGKTAASNHSFRNQKMIKQFAQTLIFIVLIFVASFFRDIIKHDKDRKKERAEMATQIARQNYLLEQERFMEKHRVFLATFLQYENHCNKIHALLYKNPNGMEKVNDKFYCKSKSNNCKSGRKLPVRIQMGDRTPLDFALIYVFLASLMFLFVRAIIDVSKEFNAPSQDANVHSHEKASSLHDYAASSRRCSNTATASATPQKKRDSKISRVSISTSEQGDSNVTGECTTTVVVSGVASNETCGSGKISFDRRSSVPAAMGHQNHLLKDTIDLRRQSFEAFNEEDENCGSDGKKHKLLRR